MTATVTVFDTFSIAISSPEVPGLDIETLGYLNLWDGGGAPYHRVGVSGSKPVYEQYEEGEEHFDVELLHNGDCSLNPATDPDNRWTLGTGWEWVSSGKMVHAGAGGNLSQTISPIGGNIYELEVRNDRNDGRILRVEILNTDNDQTKIMSGFSTTGTYRRRFTADVGDYAVRFVATSSYKGSLDNMKLRHVVDAGELRRSTGDYELIADTIRPEMFGAGFGGDDDAAFDRIVNWINAKGSGVVVEMPGTYALTRTHRITASNLTVDGKGTGVVTCSQFADIENPDNPDLPLKSFPGLHFKGPGFVEAVTTTLTAGISADAGTLTVADRSIFASGDVCTLTSDGEYWHGIGSAAAEAPHPAISAAPGFDVLFKGEWVEVWYLPDSPTDTIALTRGTVDSYSTAHTVTLRKVALNDGLTLMNLRFIGPGQGNYIPPETPSGKETDDECMSAVRVDFFVNVLESDVICEDFRQGSIAYVLCHNLRLTNPTTIGIKFDEPDNVTPGVVSQWFYGRNIGGCRDVSIVNPIGRYCRRSIDCGEASKTAFAAGAPTGEGLPTRNVAVTGGTSYGCVYLPSGHKCDGFVLSNHIARKCTGSLRIRGKNFTITGCDIEAEDGISIGTGISSYRDLAYAWKWQPNAERIIISNTRIKAKAFGILSDITIGELRLDNVEIEATQPIALYGMNQSNIAASEVRLVGDGATSGTSVGFASYSLNKDVFRNFSWRGGSVGNVKYAFVFYGSPNSIPANPPSQPTELFSDDIDIDGVRLVNISIAHLLLRTAEGQRWGNTGNILFRRSREINRLPSTKVNSGDVVVVQYENNFGWNGLALTIASGAVNIPVASPVLQLTLAGEGGNADELANITGGVPSQVLVIGNGGGTLIKLKDGTGNLRLAGDVDLSSPDDRVTLIRFATNWIQAAPLADNS